MHHMKSLFNQIYDIVTSIRMFHLIHFLAIYPSLFMHAPLHLHVEPQRMPTLEHLQLWTHPFTQPQFMSNIQLLLASGKSGNPDIESWVPLPAPLRWTRQIEIVFQAPFPHE